MHRRRRLRLSRRGVVLGHGSRLCRQLLILRRLVDRLVLLHRLILVLDRQQLLLWLLQRLRLRLPVDWLRLRHRRSRVLVVGHADSDVSSERLVGSS